jgi:tetratricopeptide (TPR) repeat protein
MIRRRHHHVVPCRFPAAVITLSLLLPAPTVAGTEEGTVPITTVSEEARAAYLEGRSLAENLRAQEARSHLQAAVAADPDFALAYMASAQSATSAKEFFDLLGRSVALAGQASEAERLWILGFEAGTKGLSERQRQLYTQLAAAYPQDPRVHNLVGIHHFGQQNWAEAIAAFERATSLAPTFSAPYNMLGYSNRFAGDFTAAEAAFQTYIELIPDDPNPYDSYAELQLKMGRYESSITTYRKALEQDEFFAASHAGIATNLNFLGRHTEARGQLERMLSSARNDGERRGAHFAMAVSHLDEGNDAQAISHIGIELALATQIDDAVAMAGDHTNTAMVHLNAGRLEAAEAHFAAALAVVEASDRDEEGKDGWRRGDLYNRGRIAAARGQFEQARGLAQELRAAAEAISNPFGLRLVHELLGIVALSAGDGTAALRELGQANQQDPANLFRQARAAQLAGDPAAARRWLERTVDFNALNSLNHAMVRHRARRMLSQM